jgi:hypothetical protein
MITTAYRIRRWTRMDLTGFQRLERVTQVFGLTVFVWTVAEEQVPSWATIQKACLGSTDWKSTLHQHPLYLGQDEKTT